MKFYRTSRSNSFRLELLGVIGCVLFNTSCNDDDVTTEDPISNSSENEALANYLLSDEYAYLQVCAQLFNPDDSLHVTPTIGAALDVTAPTVYTAGAEGVSTANQYFLQLCKQSERKDTLSDGSIDYNLGTYGTITYHPYGTNDEIATIDIAVPSLSNISQLKFIPKDLWPNNDNSSIEYGDIVEDKTNGYKWVCVQELGAGLPALFITFDAAKYVSNDKYYRYNYCATYDAFWAWYKLVKSGRALFTYGSSESKKVQNVAPNIYNMIAATAGRITYYAQGAISCLFYTGVRVEMLADFWSSAMPMCNLYHFIDGCDLDLASIRFTDGSGNFKSWYTDITAVTYVLAKREIVVPADYSVVWFYGNQEMLDTESMCADATFNCVVEHWDSDNLLHYGVLRSPYIDEDGNIIGYWSSSSTTKAFLTSNVSQSVSLSDEGSIVKMFRKITIK